MGFGILRCCLCHPLQQSAYRGCTPRSPTSLVPIQWIKVDEVVVPGDAAEAPVSLPHGLVVWTADTLSSDNVPCFLNEGGRA
mmetsp:Transcript_116424/g.340587  ORF Transcript_116424/g.340587 Transcript_116424/m.340587 type:complete len:82 (-) Transcript_116424:21-266(-)